MSENLEEEKKKQVIGLYGEMQLAMKLHAFGWQVHRILFIFSSASPK